MQIKVYTLHEKVYLLKHKDAYLWNKGSLQYYYIIHPKTSMKTDPLQFVTLNKFPCKYFFLNRSHLNEKILIRKTLYYTISLFSTYI